LMPSMGPVRAEPTAISPTRSASCGCRATTAVATSDAQSMADSWLWRPNALTALSTISSRRAGAKGLAAASPLAVPDRSTEDHHNEFRLRLVEVLRGKSLRAAVPAFNVGPRSADERRSCAPSRPASAPLRVGRTARDRRRETPLRQAVAHRRDAAAEVDGPALYDGDRSEPHGTRPAGEVRSSAVVNYPPGSLTPRSTAPRTRSRDAATLRPPTGCANISLTDGRALARPGVPGVVDQPSASAWDAEYRAARDKASFTSAPLTAITAILDRFRSRRAYAQPPRPKQRTGSPDFIVPMARPTASAPCGAGHSRS
jgi:hypothetical protein